MTSEQWARIREIFEGALERPAQDRAAYLRVLCAGDDEMRRDVEGLLASHDSSTDFLETPAVHLAQALASTGAHGEDGEYPAGYRLGPYQLERRIGRGGMGSVWLATRFDPEFNRKVAIKMVKRGMDSQEILRRFRMERQLLANLDHPNIAMLIDGGSTPEGLPYLVMEHVEGTPIDRYCEDRKLSITGRLKLFRAVCSAVQYAHQNLVVHRDIKTGNILVTAEGVPKLLDFGIAKLLRSDSSTLDLAQTRPEMRPMTLDYASPEQVRGEAITTATDIYSLGVLLYRMLTARMPYGLETRSQAALQHAIREKAPLPPSAVVLTDEDIAIPQATQKIDIAVLETRDKARKRLRRKLRGDLDMIVLKALRKEPHERYVSAEQFSEDIRRYLEGRPVIARMDTPGYRWGKFLRRNAVSVAAAVVIAAGLIGTAGVSRDRAQRSNVARLESERRGIESRRELMHTASNLGAAQLSSGDYSAAFASFNRALQIAQEFFDAESASGAKPTPDTMTALAENQARLGEVLLATGAKDAALPRFETARQRYLQAVQNGDTRSAVAKLDRMIEAARNK
ncbi:MAG TPA: serine/threonine-protein kinase [Bryobacteraceae bacterium]|nr:serine/threonine-protein kinase [Bryobacteraceae bacterium]